MNALRVSWLVLLAVGLAGCQDPQPKSVITQLPAPAYREPNWPAPEPARVRPAPRPPVAPATVEHPRRTEWLPPAGPHRPWNCIIIHHSDSPFGSLGDIDRWHRDNGWDGCGYDFVIGNGTRTRDGLVEVSQRWRRQLVGAHTKLDPDAAQRQRIDPNYYNEYGIGVCLIGELNGHRPSERQTAALAELVRFLMDEYRIPESRVFGHGDVDATDCPGRHFSMADLKRRIRTLQ